MVFVGQTDNSNVISYSMVLLLSYPISLPIIYNMQQIPLILKTSTQVGSQYDICKDGLALLRTLRSKKLRIIFNITHQASSLNNFNRWLFGDDEKQQEQQINKNACLTISKYYRELDQDRVILMLNAYEQPANEPFMILLGYLASSAFIYHHQADPLSDSSPLTHMLRRLKHHLTATDISDLYREMTFKKGYSKNPHFLCLLNQPKTEKDAFKEFYRYSEGGSEAINEAVDVLIDFFPQRSSVCLSMSKEQVGRIGKEFEESIIGREIFNFQFTGSTLQNLCFQCCQAFNRSKPLNLTFVYSKIIENQKCRLQDEVYERYINKISAEFYGGKLDYNGSNAFPLSSSQLLHRHSNISTSILDEAVKLASYCMNLSQYKNMHQALRIKFQKTLVEMQAFNQQKNEDFCRECFELLENLELCDITSSTFNDLFRQISNKLQLFTSQCSQTLGKDVCFKTFVNYLNRLQSNILQKLRIGTVEALENLQLKIQEDKVEKQDLKYNVRVLENKLRELQYQYNLQEDILNQYKMKLIHEPQPLTHQSYSSDLNKLRKRIQELEEEVQDKDLFIQELQGIIQRFEGLAQRDRLKYKFSKEIIDMIKQVSTDVNNCHSFIKQAKKTNQIYEEIKEGFAKERQAIIEERKKAMQDISVKEAHFQKIIKQKTYLEEVINEARQSIQVYKQVDENYKESISHLQNTYTQAQCLLAETQNELELFKKALSLISQQQTKGSKSEALNKFYKVSTNVELKELLKPFLKK